MIDDFCIFILTHGRPDNVITYHTLQRCGYTGHVRFIIDNEDKTGDRYRELYGDKVIVFDKAAAAKTFDEGDNFDDRRAVVYARNACFDIARRLGVRYFMQLDDDYKAFEYRFIEVGSSGRKLKHVLVKNLDAILASVLGYYRDAGVLSIALAQDGDFIGGEGGAFINSLRTRKCMNSFICDTSKPFPFMGRINEDVNMYVTLGMVGHVLLTMTQVSISQPMTQQNKGGLTDIYLAMGTFVKSFYTVMYSPSCVRVAMMGVVHKRLHHRISWKHAVPQIIREEHKKVTLHGAKP